MDRITFEQLPDAVAQLHEKMDCILEKLNKTESASQTDAEPELMSATEVSTLLGKSLATIYAMTSDKRIPFHKRGNKLYFFKKEVLQWLEDGGNSGVGNDDAFNEHLAELQGKKKRKPMCLK